MPNQVVDVQSLMGDSSDNVPGVPGIGPKKALLIVETFGTDTLNVIEETPERLAEINSIAKTKHIINEYYEEKHPNTRITNNKVEGNITVNVYGNIVSYGQSFEEEDKEAYETGLNVVEMSCEEAIRAFVDRHIQEVKAVYLKLGISYD